MGKSKDNLNLEEMYVMIMPLWYLLAHGIM